MSYHLAQINIGRLIAPPEDPRIADFIAQLAPVNALADAAPGFVWRLQSSYGNAMDIAYSDDPSINVNMSVWESVEALREFVYKSHHLKVLRDRAKWFEKMDKPFACLWWVPVGHIPTVTEGRERLEHLQLHGPTPFSFWFTKLYTPEGNVLDAKMIPTS